MEGRGEKVGAKVKRKWKRREQSEGLWKVKSGEIWKRKMDVGGGRRMWIKEMVGMSESRR